MNKFKGEYWQVNLPEDWLTETETEFVSFYHPQGYGELQISTSVFDEPVSAEMLSDLASEHLDAGAEPEEVELGEFDGFSLDYEFEDEYCREWYLMSGSILLFATYICDIGDDDKEEDLIEFILESLQLI